METDVEDIHVEDEEKLWKITENLVKKKYKFSVR